MIFKNYEEVEYVLGLTFSAYQSMLVQNYLDNGAIPPATSCQGCDENYIRATVIGLIDSASTDIENGVGDWPWPVEPPVLVESPMSKLRGASE